MTRWPLHILRAGVAAPRRSDPGPKVALAICLGLLVGCACQGQDQTATPPTVDGILSADEWASPPTTALRFARGWLLAQQHGGTLYIAVDLTADDHDDGPYKGGLANGDFLILMVDLNGDGTINVFDAAYRPRVNTLNQVVYYLAPLSIAGHEHFRPTNAQLVAGFGST